MSQRGGEDQAFLQAIRESPEDDAPRLVYADWLEEHDDLARATFIRVQCELAQQPVKERRAELEAQERALLAANRDIWLGPLAKELLPHSRCTFRRGFPEYLTVHPTIMVKLAEEFNARVPVGRVSLFGRFGDRAIKALGNSHSLGWVAGLMSHRPVVTEAVLEMIGNSPYLTNLDELSITCSAFTLKDLLALTTSPHRNALRYLTLNCFSWHGNRNPDLIAAFAAPEMRMRLYSLSLHGLNLASGGGVALAGMQSLSEVKELDLVLNSLGDHGAIALARSPYLRGLSTLGLQSGGLTSQSVRELAISPMLDGIRILNLGGNDIGNEGVEVLAGSPQLGTLGQLSLGWVDLSDRGAEILAASTHLANLRFLELAGNHITDQGSQVLFESPYLGNLERISLGWGYGESKTISLRQRKQWRKRLGKGAQV